MPLQISRTPAKYDSIVGETHAIKPLANSPGVHGDEAPLTGRTDNLALG